MVGKGLYINIIMFWYISDTFKGFPVNTFWNPLCIRLSRNQVFTNDTLILDL